MNDSLLDPEFFGDLGTVFTANLHNFLSLYGAPNDIIAVHDLNRLMWVVPIPLDDAAMEVPLYVIEEDVEPLADPTCSVCTNSGMGHFPVCCKRFWFCIPKMEDRKSELLIKDFYDGGVKLKSGLLSAMVHSNGYGHLLWVEKNEFLTGSDIMNLWTFLCNYLGVRSITLKDQSLVKIPFLVKKKTKIVEIDVMVLKYIALGNTWFGKYGYDFPRGCAEIFYRADRLCSFDMTDLYTLLRGKDGYTGLRKIVQKYSRMKYPIGLNLTSLRGILRSLLKLQDIWGKVDTSKRIYVHKGSDDAGLVRKIFQTLSKEGGLSTELLKTSLDNPKDSEFLNDICRLENVTVELDNNFYLFTLRRGQHNVLQIFDSTLALKPYEIATDIRFILEEVIKRRVLTKKEADDVYFCKSFKPYEFKMCTCLSCDVIFPGHNIEEELPPLLLVLNPKDSVSNLRAIAQIRLRETYVFMKNADVRGVLCGDIRLAEGDLVSSCEGKIKLEVYNADLFSRYRHERGY